MNNEEQIEYWLELAQYDLKTAEVMLEGKRYLYVGFMCHQAIEKILKAYYVKVSGKQPPFIHQLMRLAENSGIYNSFSNDQKDFLDLVEPLNIEARYPTIKSELLKTLTDAKCQKIIENTKDLFQWIKNLL